MSLRCNICRIELKNDDIVVLDDFAVFRHKHCYDFKKYGHLVDSISDFKSLQGKFPEFLLNLYKEAIAMVDKERRSAKEISKEEVYASLAFTLGFLDRKFD